MTLNPKTLVIIPALNEEASIAHVIGMTRQHLPEADVVVVNDGSTDRTAEIAEAAGAVVLNLPYNVGIGASVQTGFLFAARYDYDIAMRSDGDGQHESRDLCRLVEALQTGEADMVVGTRFIENRGYRATLPRRVGILILSRLISAIVGQRVTDPTSGFAAFNRQAIHLFARVYPHDYPEPEALVVAHRAGLRLREIPVTMKPRYGGRSSITSLRSVYYMIKVILAILIGLLRPAALLDDPA
ncbi:MAG: glycosyltransferase family 2 protein [Anaerolineae bacterium]|nr:glycosyltransferase family 2 protein [Anaerolineae bacterium]